MGLNGGQICHAHHALGEQEPAARSSDSNSGFEEGLTGLLVVVVGQQNEEGEGDAFGEDKIHAVETKFAAVDSCQGDNFSRRVDAQSFGVVGDVRG